MTRSFGDIVAKSVGVSCHPEIKEFELNEDSRFIILASDGLWDRLTNEEIVRIVGNEFYPQRDIDGAINYLMSESVQRWKS